MKGALHLLVDVPHVLFLPQEGQIDLAVVGQEARAEECGDEDLYVLGLNFGWR